MTSFLFATEDSDSVSILRRRHATEAPYFILWKKPHTHIFPTPSSSAVNVILIGFSLRSVSGTSFNLQ